VTLQDGQVLTKRVDYPLGNALNPVSDKQLEGKFNSLVVPAIGEKRAKAIVDLSWNLDRAMSIGDLMKILWMPSE
jgi:2-methylcitrate dehydratase PrpD